MSSADLRTSQLLEELEGRLADAKYSLGKSTLVRTFNPFIPRHARKAYWTTHVYIINDDTTYKHHSWQTYHYSRNDRDHKILHGCQSEEEPTLPCYYIYCAAIERDVVLIKLESLIDC